MIVCFIGCLLRIVSLRTISSEEQAEINLLNGRQECLIERIRVTSARFTAIADTAEPSAAINNQSKGV
jgi:hypothetical protein